MIHHNLHGQVENPILRIGLDLCMTSFQNDTTWAKHFSTERCVAETPHASTPADLTSHDYDTFKKICAPCFNYCIENPDLVRAYPVIPGVLETIADLHSKGAIIHVITTRPRNLVEQATIDSLCMHGFDQHVATLTFADLKRPVCEYLDLDILIDDAPHVLAEFTKPDSPSDLEIIMLDRPYNRDIPDVTHATDWNEIHTILLARLEAAADALESA